MHKNVANSWQTPSNLDLNISCLQSLKLRGVSSKDQRPMSLSVKENPLRVMALGTHWGRVNIAMKTRPPLDCSHPPGKSSKIKLWGFPQRRVTPKCFTVF